MVEELAYQTRTSIRHQLYPVPFALQQRILEVRNTHTYSSCAIDYVSSSYWLVHCIIRTGKAEVIYDFSMISPSPFRLLAIALDGWPLGFSNQNFTVRNHCIRSGITNINTNSKPCHCTLSAVTVLLSYLRTGSQKRKFFRIFASGIESSVTLRANACTLNQSANEYVVTVFYYYYICIFAILQLTKCIVSIEVSDDVILLRSAHMSKPFRLARWLFVRDRTCTYTGYSSGTTNLEYF